MSHTPPRIFFRKKAASGSSSSMPSYRHFPSILHARTNTCLRFGLLHPVGVLPVPDTSAKHTSAKGEPHTPQSSGVICMQCRQEKCSQMAQAYRVAVLLCTQLDHSMQPALRTWCNSWARRQKQQERVHTCNQRLTCPGSPACAPHQSTWQRLPGWGTAGAGGFRPSGGTATQRADKRGATQALSGYRPNAKARLPVEKPNNYNTRNKRRT